jgi:hypothetical protein
MNQSLFSPKRLLATIATITAGLIVAYGVLTLFTFTIDYFGEVRKYSHCDTYQGFAKTAQARNITPDSTRLLAMQATRLELEMYLQEHEQYPVITSGTPKDRWHDLLTSLEIEAEGRDKFTDPCAETNPNYVYTYGSDESGTDYVLRAIMSMEGIYESDINNERYGIWCGETNNTREYCVGPAM